MDRINVNLPAIVFADRYYDFSKYVDVFRNIIKGLKIKRLGYDGFYVGIAYVGKLPNSKVIKKLLKNSNVEFLDE